MPRKGSLEQERTKKLKGARRLVIKLGTRIVTGPEGGVTLERVEPIVGSIAALMKSGRSVILVSSGAVGLGRAALGLSASRVGNLVTKQACAAIGQGLLMDAYRGLFARWGLRIAQVLLTEDDFTVWSRYSNLKGTIDKLLQFGVVPIINENDTVSTTEIASINPGGNPGGPGTRSAVFSDNDHLAALVMSGLGADALLLLTDMNGFLRDGPRRPGARSAGAASADGEIIPVIDRVTPHLRALAAGPSPSGRGGMLTKLEAAEIAMHCGGTAVIANGSQPGVVDQVFAGKPAGTAFLPLKRMQGKRRWIAFAANVEGRITVDAGAEKVLTAGKASLLASGIVRVESHFAPNDVVGILGPTGEEIARGIAGCASHEVEAWLSTNPAPRATAARPSRTKGVPLARTQDAQGSRTPIVVRRDNIVLIRK